MDRDTIVTFHRRRPGQDEDRVITQGPVCDIIRQFNNMRATDRPQYSMMHGGMHYNYLEIENIAREFEGTIERAARVPVAESFGFISRIVAENREYYLTGALACTGNRSTRTRDS